MASAHTPGDRWELHWIERGLKAEVWLKDRSENGREIWMWSVFWDDGSTVTGQRNSDWTPTFKSASDEARSCLHAVVAMSRNPDGKPIVVPRFRKSAIALARKGSDQTNNQVVAPGGGGGM